MTTKIDPSNWEFRNKVEKIINDNVKSFPYEGDEINRSGIVEDIIELLSSKEYSLLKHTKSEKL